MRWIVWLGYHCWKIGVLYILIGIPLMYLLLE